MISVILLEPLHEGNVGAVARVMKNFGFSNLILVKPRCTLGEEAKKRAKHAGDVLDNAQIVDDLPAVDYLIGTSAQVGSDYNVLRNPLLPEELSMVLPQEGHIGLLFGREEDGLTNEELKQCDFLLTIPSHADYPVLNLSHAVGIVLYELGKHTSTLTEDITPISGKEKEQLLKMVDDVLAQMTFSTPEKKETQRLVWKKIIGKSFLSKREAYALMGFLKKLL